jgi:hypothetical protein
MGGGRGTDSEAHAETASRTIYFEQTRQSARNNEDWRDMDEESGIR